MLLVEVERWLYLDEVVLVERRESLDEEGLDDMVVGEVREVGVDAATRIEC